MLSKELALYRIEHGRIHPDCLTRRTHASYLELADRLLNIYRQGAGKTREQLQREATAVFRSEPDCPVQRTRALIRLVDQACEYETNTEGGALALRQKVFLEAAGKHPLVSNPDALFEHSERKVKEEIAAGIGRTWASVERALYADLPAFHRLIKLNRYASPDELLSRYNVAQAQTLLFWAEEVTIVARQDFRRILRHAKFNRLLHEIRMTRPQEYTIRLSGPACVLGATRRYGVHMATFLPGLLACGGWQMSAMLKMPHGQTRFQLSPADGLRSHLPESEPFDSEVERAFAEKFGQHRDGWQLSREGVILVRGQRVFIPDFAFRHKDGTTAYLEIVGFWTPEYLAKKAETLACFTGTPIILAVAAPAAAVLPQLGFPTLSYKTKLKIGAVLEQLETVRGM